MIACLFSACDPVDIGELLVRRTGVKRFCFALTGVAGLMMMVFGLVPGTAGAATAGHAVHTSVVEHTVSFAPNAGPSNCKENGVNNVAASYLNHDLQAVEATYSFLVTCPKGVARVMGDQAYEYFKGREASKGNHATCTGTGCAKLDSHGRAICDAGKACAGLYQLHAVWTIGLNPKYKWGKVPSFCTVTQSRHLMTCRVTTLGARVPATH
jgi:hypothetical protein